MTKSVLLAVATVAAVALAVASGPDGAPGKAASAAVFVTFGLAASDGKAIEILKGFSVFSVATLGIAVCGYMTAVIASTIF